MRSVWSFADNWQIPDTNPDAIGREEKYIRCYRNEMAWVFKNIECEVPLGFKLRVSNVGSPACDNNV